MRNKTVLKWSHDKVRKKMLSGVLVTNRRHTLRCRFRRPLIFIACSLPAGTSLLFCCVGPMGRIPESDREKRISQNVRALARRAHNRPTTVGRRGAKQVCTPALNIRNMRNSELETHVE